MNTEPNIDDIINKLTEAKRYFPLFYYLSYKPGKQINLLESEIKYLCINAKNVILSQPVLIEIEAPVKICGIKFCLMIRRYSWTILRFIKSF